MGSALDLIVPISIKFGTVQPTSVAFGVPLIASQFATNKTTVAFTRIRKYTDLASLVADGWVTSDAVYKAAAAILSQSPSVKFFYVGRKDSGDAAWGAALDAINAEADGWYGLSVIPVGTVTADIIVEQLAVAAWVETQTKLCVLQTADATVPTNGITTDAASRISALVRNRTGVIYHPVAGEYADAAWLGNMLTKDPGSANWAYKDISNAGVATVTPDALTPAAKSVIWGKFCNTFSSVAGIRVTERGLNAHGSYGYLDVQMGVDWIYANLQTEIFTALATNDKIPYTDDGIAAIVGIVKAVLAKAAAKNIIVGSTIVVTAPLYSEIETADKSARNLPNVKFSARLAGAINTVTIAGTVSL